MLRIATIEELKALYKEHITADFSPNEYPPLAVLRRQVQKGVHMALFHENDAGEADGYAVTAASCKNGYVLITLLAAFRGRRGQGVGSALIGDLCAHYRDRRGLLIEVEKPALAGDEGERAVRERRIAFYERNGFILLPHIDYAIFGVPMFAMVRQLDGEAEPEEAYIARYREVYEGLLGPLFLCQLKARWREGGA